jgi:hypothetical protein
MAAVRVRGTNRTDRAVDVFRTVTTYAAVPLLSVTSSGALAFDMSHRYTLREGGEHEVCRHMLDVYNTRFVKAWSRERPKGTKREVKAAVLSGFARYPSSPEFDAIKWQVQWYTVGSMRIDDVALYAQFDIDNDGTDELVVWKGFFNGSPGSWDYLSIFGLGAFDIRDLRTAEDFLGGFSEKRKAVLGYPVHQRPFIYRGRTYLHGYTYTPRGYPGADPAEPFAPPENILIREYVGGPANDAEVQNRSGSMRLVCKYDMIQRPKR